MRKAPYLAPLKTGATERVLESKLSNQEAAPTSWKRKASSAVWPEKVYVVSHVSKGQSETRYALTLDEEPVGRRLYREDL